METAMSSLKAHSQTLYETDYLQWIETIVEKLQSQDYANVDWENLIEEIADMGRFKFWVNLKSKIQNPKLFDLYP
jgi:hypothetical protein